VEVRYLGKPPVDLPQDSGTWSYNSLDATTKKPFSSQSKSVSRTTWNPDAIGMGCFNILLEIAIGTKSLSLDVTMNPNKQRKGNQPSTPFPSTTTGVLTSVTASLSEVSTAFSTANNGSFSSDYLNWQHQKQLFLDSISKNKSQEVRLFGMDSFHLKFKLKINTFRSNLIVQYMR